MAGTRYARPTAELAATQRHAKELWRQQQAQLPFDEKIRLLLELQRKLYPVLQQRRRMRPWERPWEIEP
jgi:hypothetical protein